MEGLKKCHRVFLILSIVLSLATLFTFFRLMIGFDYHSDSDLIKTLQLRRYIFFFASVFSILITAALKSIIVALQQEVYELLYRINELEKKIRD